MCEMDTAIIVLGQMASLFFVIFIGYIMTRKGLFKEEFVKGLGSYITKAGMPVAVILSLQQEFSLEKLAGLGVVSAGMVAATLCGILPCLLLCVLRRIPLRESGVWMASASFGNVLFIGSPIMTAIYRDEAVFPLSALMFTFHLLCFTIGIFLISLGGEKGHFSARSAVRSLLFNNCIIGAAIGLLMFVFSVKIPAPITGGMQLVMNTLSPCAMLVLGYSLAQIPIVDLFNDVRVYLVCAVKLLVCPIFTFLALRSLITAPALLGALCIGAAMPTANTIGVLCEQQDNNQVLCAKITFSSTLLSGVTAPLCMLIMHGWL